MIGRCVFDHKARRYRDRSTGRFLAGHAYTGFFGSGPCAACGSPGLAWVLTIDPDPPDMSDLVATVLEHTPTSVFESLVKEDRRAMRQTMLQALFTPMTGGER
jgi:hypothetical protein